MIELNGENLRQTRIQAGLTQSQLAEELGVRQQTIQRWETGISGIGPYNFRLLKEFCQESGWDIENLLLKKRASSSVDPALFGDIPSEHHIPPSDVRPICLSDPSANYSLVQSIPPVKDGFIGRDDLLSAIDDKLSSNRILFLEGIGAIGKTELAKHYAWQYRDKYDCILFCVFSQSLLDMVCDPQKIVITGLSKPMEESRLSFFFRKMNILRALANGRTLMIVDNYDVAADPHFSEFIRGSHRIIFTSRKKFHAYSWLSVDRIRHDEDLIRLFSFYSEQEITPAEKPDVITLLKMTGYHTYAAELLAKQMKASNLSVHQLLLRLRQSGLAHGPEEVVPGRNALEDKQTAFAHIRSIFSVDTLAEEEKQILRELSIVGYDGIPADTYKAWGRQLNYNSLNRLVEHNWVQERQEKDGEKSYMLHPLIAEVIQEALSPTPENCADFIHEMDSHLQNAWRQPYEENIKIKSAVIAITSYFKPERQILSVCLNAVSYFRQIGEFEHAIRYGISVYQACLTAYGESSLQTSSAARVLAESYHNAGRLNGSFPWYERSFESALPFKAVTAVEVARAYD